MIGKSIEAQGCRIGNNRLYIAGGSSSIGMGTTNPDQDLHIKTASGTCIIKAETTADDEAGFQMTNDASTWLLKINSDNKFVIRNPGGAGDALYVDTSGNLIMGGTSPDNASIMQLDSTSQGFLPPRMTSVQKAAVTTPLAGLIIYDSNLGKLCVYTGAAWETVTSV